MIFKADISNKILYITEDINHNEFINICARLGVDNEWTIRPDVNISTPYYPTSPYPQPGTNPYNTWVPMTYCSTTAKNS